jgi:hypothetical protein
MRKAFDDEEEPYLPKVPAPAPSICSDTQCLQFSELMLTRHSSPQHILYRQKEQFSDGVGYSWIDGLKAFTEQQVIHQPFKLSVQP